MENLKALHNIAKAYDSIVAIAAAEALRFYKNRFVEQNFIDNATQTWKPTKGRRALSKTGTLKRSIRIINISNTSQNTRIRIGTSEKYAQIHNVGQLHAGRNCSASEVIRNISTIIQPYTKRNNVTYYKLYNLHSIFLYAFLYE